MSGIMSISGAKETERERLNREIEEFKAKGGEIKKVPTHSEGYGYQNFRESKKRLESKHPTKPSTFSPKAEAKRLEQAEANRLAAIKKRNPHWVGSPEQERLANKGNADAPWES